VQGRVGALANESAGGAGRDRAPVGDLAGATVTAEQGCQPDPDHHARSIGQRPATARGRRRGGVVRAIDGRGLVARIGARVVGGVGTRVLVAVRARVVRPVPVVRLVSVVRLVGARAVGAWALGVVGVTGSVVGRAGGEFVGEHIDHGRVVDAEQVGVQQPQVDMRLDDAAAQLPSPRRDGGGHRVGQGHHVVVGLAGRVVREVEPGELGGAGGRGTGHDPGAGLGGLAAGLVPGRVDVRGDLLDQRRPGAVHQHRGLGEHAGDHAAGLLVVEVTHHRDQDRGLGLRHPPLAHRLSDHREAFEDLMGEVVAGGGHRGRPRERGGRGLRGVAINGGAAGGAGAGAARGEQPAAALPHGVVLRLERREQPGVRRLARHRVRVHLEIEHLGHHRCHDSNTSSRVRHPRADPDDRRLLHLSEPLSAARRTPRRCRGTSGPRGRRRRRR
jgi:hypothetical protein